METFDPRSQALNGPRCPSNPTQSRDWYYCCHLAKAVWAKRNPRSRNRADDFPIGCSNQLRALADCASCARLRRGAAPQLAQAAHWPTARAAPAADVVPLHSWPSVDFSCPSVELWCHSRPPVVDQSSDAHCVSHSWGISPQTWGHAVTSQEICALVWIRSAQIAYCHQS